MKSYSTIDEYIAAFPKETQQVLKQFRSVIHAAAPRAIEAIKYGMPTFVQGKNLVHFAAFKNHFGFFPTPSGVAAFTKELAPYKTSKGTIQFQNKKPIPWVLVTKIVKFRVKEVAI